jgi:hypothetical protein
MMYRAKPGLVIGFHGCDVSVRTAVVLNETKLFPSKNDYDWLGHGIYFWENNRHRAIQFAKELQEQVRKNRAPIVQPATLGAVIDMGYCLDLMDSECLNLIRTSYEKLATAYDNFGAKIPVNKSTSFSNQKLIRTLDCAVIENLHKLRLNLCLEPFDSVRSVFVEGEELYPNASFNEKNHIQLCIRNPNCIKGYFIPRDQDETWEIP